MDSPSGDPCRECIVGSGCKLYNTGDSMPKKCSEWDCAYSQMENVSIDIRPDKCGVIFEKASDLIMWGTYKGEIRKGGAFTNQVHSFINEGFSVVLKEIYTKDPAVVVNEKHSPGLITSELGMIREKYNGIRN